MIEEKRPPKDTEMMVAKMEIPENQIQFIVSIFGKRPEENDTSFTMCLAQKIEVVTDSKHGLCRLKMDDWKDLEALNVKYMS